MEAQPGLRYERAFAAQSLTLVAGLDEAGRGALAGPVTAGAVVLPLDRVDLRTALDGVRDSKMCSASQRETLYNVVFDVALAAAVGMADAREIEALNIIGATRLAMRRALDALSVSAEALLIDGKRLRLRQVDLPQKSMSRGEHHSLSIAAASILAKVSRDRMMISADEAYPDYGFAQHKGYGTPEHKAAIAAHGPCEIHRRTFAPVRHWLLDHLIDS